MSGPYGNTTPIMPCGPAFSTPLLLSFGGEFGVYRREERMSARRRKSDLLQTPSSSLRHTEMTGESVQLQQELETLKQVHSSIKALNHMTVTLYKTLEVVVQNSNDLQGLNEGWQIFFGQK